ncbi:MAG: hypothetical protein LBK53_00055 [Heliobacteriaceae bacterium]|jgi:hypothetical protein|nr:hypothetical protein [Heliobacteriaceae bacterium]
MDGILAKSHSRADRTHKTEKNGNPGQVETAGSLALWQQGLLMSNLYDSFVTNNPFSVDYSAYGFDTVAYGGFLDGFMSSFSGAMSVLGDGSFSDGGFSGGGFASSGGGFSGGGGFSSVC